MTVQQMILVDPDALARLEAEVARLAAVVERVQMTPEPKWVTVSECAAKVGRSPETVRRWAKSGEIESRRMGGTLMVKVE
jgi:excisionase family DNA binding protein